MRTGIFHSSTQINGWKTFFTWCCHLQEIQQPTSLSPRPARKMAARILKIQVIYKPFQFLSPTHITNHFALSFINSFWRTIPAIPFLTPFQSNTHKTVITGKGKNAKFSAMSSEMPKSDTPISLRSKITRHTCNVFISLGVSGQN